MGLYVVGLLVISLSASCFGAPKFRSPQVHVKRIASERMPIASGALNEADYLGATVTLQCYSSGAGTRIMWYEFQTDPAGTVISDNDVISVGHPYAPRYAMLHRNATEYNLVISPITMLDGGYYVCADDNANEPEVIERGAQLIVIRETMNCTTNIAPTGLVIEGTYYSIECDLYFSGGTAPNMTWSGPRPFVDLDSQTQTDVWSGIGFFADRTFDMLSFTNLANFTRPGFNIPDYNPEPPTWSETYTSVVLDVYWPPKNLQVLPQKPSYEIGDLITCYADAEPPPSYSWHDLTDNTNWNTQSITLTSDMVGLNQLRASAMNAIDGQIYTSDFLVNITVNALTTTTTPAPTTTTQAPPPVGVCNDLTGRWSADNGDMVCFRIDEDGIITGIIQRLDDPYWSDIVGITEVGNYEEASFSAILPGTMGVQGYVGECHMCRGVETLTTNYILRSKDAVDGDCGVGSPVTSSQQTTFTRNPGECGY